MEQPFCFGGKPNTNILPTFNNYQYLFSSFVCSSHGLACGMCLCESLYKLFV